MNEARFPKLVELIFSGRKLLSRSLRIRLTMRSNAERFELQVSINHFT